MKYLALWGVMLVTLSSFCQTKQVLSNAHPNQRASEKTSQGKVQEGKFLIESGLKIEIIKVNKGIAEVEVSAPKSISCKFDSILLYAPNQVSYWVFKPTSYRDDKALAVTTFLVKLSLIDFTGYIYVPQANIYLVLSRNNDKTNNNDNPSYKAIAMYPLSNSVFSSPESVLYGDLSVLPGDNSKAYPSEPSVDVGITFTRYVDGKKFGLQASAKTDPRLQKDSLSNPPSAPIQNGQPSQTTKHMMTYIYNVLHSTEQHSMKISIVMTTFDVKENIKRSYTMRSVELDLDALRAVEIPLGVKNPHQIQISARVSPPYSITPSCFSNSTELETVDTTINEKLRTIQYDRVSSDSLKTVFKTKFDTITQDAIDTITNRYKTAESQNAYFKQLSQFNSDKEEGETWEPLPQLNPILFDTILANRSYGIDQNGIKDLRKSLLVANQALTRMKRWKRFRDTYQDKIKIYILIVDGFLKGDIKIDSTEMPFMRNYSKDIQEHLFPLKRKMFGDSVFNKKTDQLLNEIIFFYNKAREKRRLETGYEPERIKMYASAELILSFEKPNEASYVTVFALRRKQGQKVNSDLFNGYLINQSKFDPENLATSIKNKISDMRPDPLRIDSSILVSPVCSICLYYYLIAFGGTEKPASIGKYEAKDTDFMYDAFYKCNIAYKKIYIDDKK